MGTDDLRSLYWPGSFRALYQQLQAADAAAEPRLRELLAARADWLLGGLPKFQPPSEGARRDARDAFKAGKLVLAGGGDKGGDKGGGAQRVTLDARLKDAALQLSAILVRANRPRGLGTRARRAAPRGAWGGARVRSAQGRRMARQRRRSVPPAAQTAAAASPGPHTA